MQYRGTLMLERELEALGTKAQPLNPRTVEAASHDEAARLIKAEAERFHGEPVTVVQTTEVRDPFYNGP